eukprot:TRINITY_DN19232_c0_g1_i1.p1 TRINITY_DN19232_c0_g1~~TRINITY_DN19232_c0_g1_i1.p1  ORF type:complete len:223 (+),score=6.91 TRINITY_DN19232_c0_g1_i1:59-727(+)
MAARLALRATQSTSRTVMRTPRSDSYHLYHPSSRIHQPIRCISTAKTTNHNQVQKWWSNWNMTMFGVGAAATSEAILFPFDVYGTGLSIVTGISAAYIAKQQTPEHFNSTITKPKNAFSQSLRLGHSVAWRSLLFTVALTMTLGCLHLIGLTISPQLFEGNITSIGATLIVLLATTVFGPLTLAIMGFMSVAPFLLPIIFPISAIIARISLWMLSRKLRNTQ